MATALRRLAGVPEIRSPNSGTALISIVLLRFQCRTRRARPIEGIGFSLSLVLFLERFPLRVRFDLDCAVVNCPLNKPLVRVAQHPVDVRPAEVRPAEDCPAEVRLAEVRPRLGLHLGKDREFQG